MNLLGFKTTLAAILTSGGEIAGTDGNRLLARDADSNPWHEVRHVVRSNGDVDIIMERCDGFPKQGRLF